MSQYPYDATQPRELKRLQSMEETFDPGTIRVLEALGVREGWRCLEVGGGAGSIARWLSHRVGATGHVIATDIDTRFLDQLATPNLEVRKHDITSGCPGISEFGLVHARLILDLLPARDEALNNMVASLTPGGWLVVEEFDSITSVPDKTCGVLDLDLFVKMQEAMRRLWAMRGFDAEYGRKLVTQLQRRGLEAVGAEGRVFMRQGGPLNVRSYRLSVEQLRHDYVRAGLVTNEDVDAHLQQLDDPNLSYMSPLMMAAWGRRPSP